MVISDKFRFAFLHIPKCAGTSVRAALAPLNDRHEEYFVRSVDHHEGLGLLDYHHLPLKVLREYFTDDYRCVEDYLAFAIVRDPTSRFPSSLAQRLLMYKGRNLGDLTANEVRSEIDEIIAQLSSLPSQAPVLKPELIHFARQIDYIEIDGHRPIENIYTVEEMDQLFLEIENITSHSFRADDVKNIRFQYKYPGLIPIDRVARGTLSAVLPASLWIPFSSAIKRALIRNGILQKKPELHSDTFTSCYVQNFISDFYRDDVTLYNEISKI